MRTIAELGDLRDKKVLMRADFDVPVSEDMKIREPFRIQKQKDTLDYLVERGAKVVLATHIAELDSFRALLDQLQTHLGRPLGFIENKSGIAAYLENYREVGLLNNIRTYDGEKSNDRVFAQELAAGFDLYVNNAFAVSHRAHASVSAVADFLPAYAGLQTVQEVNGLVQALDAPAKGKVVIMGGAKAETKLPVVKNFIDKAEHILVGGVVANDILKALGQDMDGSRVDENYLELLEGLDLKNPKLVVPKDFNRSDGKLLDIGPQTIAEFSKVIAGAKMVIWNGPLGIFEQEAFAVGTDAVSRAVADSDALSIIGGGDTIAAVNRLGILDKFGFVSTGGGAMLAFLAGQELPGLKAVGYY